MNKYNPNIHGRKSIRFKGYDYSQAGLYFITICVQDRECLFGDVVNGEMMLNDAGRMVENEWLKLPQRFTNIELHEYAVMPNHFHAIIEIVGATLVVAQNDIGQIDMGQPENQNGQPVNQNGQPVNQNGQPVNQNGQPENQNGQTVNQNGQPQGIAPTKPKTLGDMMGAFQSIVTVQYIRGLKQQGWKSFNGKLWQRNYWEHIVRNEQSYQRISEYICNNPKKWEGDKFYQK